MFYKDNCILLRICFSLQEKQFPTITPSKQMQILILSVIDASTLSRGANLAVGPTPSLYLD